MTRNVQKTPGKWPNRLREIRKRKGMTQGALALAAGFSDKSDISRLESGAYQLTAEKMERLAAALGCKPGELLRDKDEAQDDDEALFRAALQVMSPAEREELRIYLRKRAEIARLRKSEEPSNSS